MASESSFGFEPDGPPFSSSSDASLEIEAIFRFDIDKVHGLSVFVGSFPLPDGVSGTGGGPYLASHAFAAGASSSQI